MAPRRRPIAALLATMLLVVAALALGACGEEDKTEIVEGEPVELGELSYNVLFSRFLNPNDVEDADYLVGQPPPDPDSLYLGVFLQVENHGEDPQLLPGSLIVTDTEDQEFETIESESLYALPLGVEIAGDTEFPVSDSTAAAGPIAGSMLLFEVPDEAADNRPLKLIIPGDDGPAEVELDI